MRKGSLTLCYPLLLTGRPNDLIGLSDALGHLTDGPRRIDGDDEVPAIQIFRDPLESVADLLLLGDGFVDLQLVGTSPHMNARHAVLGGHVQKDTPVGTANVRAVQIHVGYPLKILALSLIGHGRIVVAIRNNSLTRGKPSIDLGIVPNAVQ